MNTLKRDENKITLCGGANAAVQTVTIPLRVDPVTGRLLVSLDVCSDADFDVNKETFIDENRVNVSSAVTDDVNKTVRPFKVCPDHQYLVLDILFE